MFGVILSHKIKKCADFKVATPPRPNVSLTDAELVPGLRSWSGWGCTGGDELLLASRNFLVTPHKIRQNEADFHLSILTLIKGVTKALALEQCDNIDLTWSNSRRAGGVSASWSSSSSPSRSSSQSRRAAARKALEVPMPSYREHKVRKHAMYRVVLCPP